MPVSKIAPVYGVEKVKLVSTVPPLLVVIVSVSPILKPETEDAQKNCYSTGIQLIFWVAFCVLVRS